MEWSMNSSSRPCLLSVSRRGMCSSSTCIGEVSRPSLLMKTSSRTVIGGVRLPHRGKRVWQILSQWMWNLRQELSQQWQPTPMRLTVFAEVQTAASPPSAHVASQSISEPSLEEPSFGPPQWARAARVGSLGGEHFVLQPTGTLRCQEASHSLPTRTTPRARWNAPRALFCPYCRLSRVSHTHTMSRAWHLHQKASAADARCCIHCPNRRTKRVHRPRRCIRIILLLTRLFPIRSSGATGHARSPAAPGSSGNDVTRFS